MPELLQFPGYAILKSKVFAKAVDRAYPLRYCTVTLEPIGNAIVSKLCVKTLPMPTRAAVIAAVK